MPSPSPFRQQTPFSPTTPACGLGRPGAYGRGLRGASLVSTLVFTVLAMALVAVLAGTLGAVWWYRQLPDLDKITHYQPQQALQVFTSDGVEIAQFGAERRLVLPLAQIPLRMQDAVLSIEDTRFRHHHGIDPIGLARAVVANLTGGRLQGASTITQQVARTFFLSTRKTAERKIKEALLAIKIEQTLTKDQILALYMNQIYLGQRAYGFGAAAQVYFGKNLGQLSVAETAMLAGLPQNPSFANPVVNLERAVARQRLVLKRMRDLDVIDEAAWQGAKAEKLSIRAPTQVNVHAEYVAELARQAVVDRFGDQAYTQGYKVYTTLIAADQQAAYRAVRRGVLDFERRHAYQGPEDNEPLPVALAPHANQDTTEEEQAAALALKDYTDDDELRVAIVMQASDKELIARLVSGERVRVHGEGLRWVQSALAAKAPPDLAIRRGAIIRLQKQTHGAAGGGGPGAQGGSGADGASATWAVSQWPQVQSALVSMTSDSGRIRAMVGGFDFADHQFNHVTQAWRQPGSSFKPFLYSAALEKDITPATVLDDVPLSTSADGSAPDWNPQNSDGQFMGPMTLRNALAQSRNLVSVRLLQQIGLPWAREWTQRFGFTADRQPNNLTLALGTGSTTPLQLASAYAVLANGGFRVAPVLIERITDAQDKLLFAAPPPAPLTEVDRVVPARNAFVTNSLLQEVTRTGTAAKAQAQLQRPDIFGKTGTTNDAVDAWFAGFQPGLVAVVWTGYDDARSLGTRESGGGASLPTWIDYITRALQGVPVFNYTQPEGVALRDGDWVYTTTTTTTTTNDDTSAALAATPAR
jgi:penicillin-binding protein 1A